MTAVAIFLLSFVGTLTIFTLVASYLMAENE